jgi:hypothetical protein
MATSKLSVNDFRDRLRNEVQEVATAHGWDINSSNGRGYAFQLWIASLFCNEDRGYDTEPEDSLLYSTDLKADIVLEDTARRHLLIAQCKYEGMKKEVDIQESQVNDFFNRHELYLNSKWVQDHGSDSACDLLGDYKEKMALGYTVEYFFVSTGRASQRIHELTEMANSRFSEKNIPIKCHLVDFSALKEFYVRSQSLEESPPPEVRLQIPSQKFIQMEKPYPTIIAVLKGNSLRNLYSQYNDSLFSWNIRGYLGGRGVNEGIRDTAKERPSDFFYFNNGVSAICTDFQLAGNELVVANFQIINGAQTIGALAKVPASPDIEVLFRLTRTASVKTEKGFNSDIIRYNNSQNVIKVSDFRSNDQIQVWLERQFHELKPRNSLPLLKYVRKRSTPRKGPGRPLKLEELAKIRYSFLCEPTLCHESPKDLWTPIAEEGAYEKAFGVDGELPELWTKDEFHRCLIAIAFYLKIESACREEKKRDPRLTFLMRLRFHALSLAGEYLKSLKDPQSKLLDDAKLFEDVWKNFWQDARRILIDGHFDAIEREKGTLHALVRSSERWSQMRRKLSLYVGLTS